jgi:Flp pilus assembly secretin CpaC
MFHMEVCAELWPAGTPEKPDARRLPKREALTAETMIPEGSTLVLRGSVRDVRSSTSAEVPVLGRLPLVGKLFRATATTTRRCELLVLITPHIVGPQDDHVAFHDASAGSVAASAARSADPRVQFVRAVLADSEIPTAQMVRCNARDPQGTPASDTAWQTRPVEAVGTPGPLVNFSASPLPP